jgi:hypothetical protein
MAAALLAAQLTLCWDCVVLALFFLEGGCSMCWMLSAASIRLEVNVQSRMSRLARRTCQLGNSCISATSKRTSTPAHSLAGAAAVHTHAQRHHVHLGSSSRRPLRRVTSQPLVFRSQHPHASTRRCWRQHQLREDCQDAAAEAATQGWRGFICSRAWGRCCRGFCGVGVGGRWEAPCWAVRCACVRKGGRRDASGGFGMCCTFYWQLLGQGQVLLLQMLSSSFAACMHVEVWVLWLGGGGCCGSTCADVHAPAAGDPS